MSKITNLSKQEIITMYKTAKNKEEQIPILADLTASDVDTILEILKDAKVFNGAYSTCSRCGKQYPTISHHNPKKRCAECRKLASRISKIKFQIKKNNSKIQEIQRSSAKYREELDKLEAEWEV